jgi:hypothetical protein
VRDLGALWLRFADTACRGYSPIYDRISRVVAESDEILDLVSEAPARGHNPLLLLAAVHFLVLGDMDHPLARVYSGDSTADPGPLFVDLCLAHRAEVLELLATEQVNTNEVGRSAVLGPALTHVASRTGASLAQLDVGCSAGLNLFCDRYRLDYGPAGATGPPDAAVRIVCEVVGGRPPIAPTLPAIVARVGLDQSPVDVSDPRQLQWQLACAWPDTGRLPRTRRALDQARRDPATLHRGDAVARSGELLATLPDDALAVVTTTWVVAYLSAEKRDGFRDALAVASKCRPVVWISAEGQGVVDLVPTDGDPPTLREVEASVLGLVTFRDGDADAELLGYVHPHGSALDWRADR